MDSSDEVQQPPAPRTRSRMDSIPREEWERILIGEHPPVVQAAAAPPAHPPELTRKVSRQQSIERSEPAPTSVALPSVDLRRTSLLQRASSQRSLQNTSGSGHQSSASDGLEPALTIGLNPRTINKKEHVHDVLDNMDDAERQWESAHNSTSTGSGRSKIDRDVIVTSEHSAASIASLTPLGRPRRQSLFERVNGGSAAEFANVAAAGVPQGDWGVSEHNNNTLVQKEKEGDSLELEDGDPPENSPAVVGRNHYHTVLRDWLMHVVEKDDDQDTKVRRGS